MIRTMFAAAAVFVGVTAVAAQSDPIAVRKGIMKEVGAQTKTGASMAKGEAPFEAEKARVIFATYAEAAEKMPALFPENSKTGGDTAALPKIWEDMNDFKAKFAALGKEAKDAQSAAADADKFKVAFGAVTKNCGGCHESYRLKRN